MKLWSTYIFQNNSLKDFTIKKKKYNMENYPELQRKHGTLVVLAFHLHSSRFWSEFHCCNEHVEYPTQIFASTFGSSPEYEETRVVHVYPMKPQHQNVGRISSLHYES